MNKLCSIDEYNRFMYNSKRTLEVFGYDLENQKRRSKEELERMGKTKPKDMDVIDNCPSCSAERTIKLNQSRKNKPCNKCFHNTPKMQQIKLAQKGKVLTEEHKQKMKDNHWSKTGTIGSPFKGKSHSKVTKDQLAQATENFYKKADKEIIKQFKIKESCTKRGIPIEEFDGFSAPENTRIRQSAEGKAWIYDVLSKANFTCVKCNERGGSLHAHHKNSFNSFPDQRFEIENGACLCETCHNSFHEKYGKGNNTEDQFNRWVDKNEN